MFPISVPGYFRAIPGPLTENFKMKEKSSLLTHTPFLTLSKGCESQGKVHSFLNLLKGENRLFTQWEKLLPHCCLPLRWIYIFFSVPLLEDT